MQLHLVVPGLLWPPALLRDNCQDLELPALATLLGRARIHWLPASAPEAALYRAFSVPCSDPPATAQEGLPLAALRRLGEGSPMAPGLWLCADPVHLALQRTRLILERSAPPATATELEQISHCVNALLDEPDTPEFLQAARYVAGHQGHGYLHLPASAPASAQAIWQRLHTRLPSMAANHEEMLPLGDDQEARRWRSFANVLQMRLHQLPANQARETNAQALLNSLWLWGVGRLPTDRMAATAQRPLRVLHTPAPQPVMSNAPLLAGLARLQEQPVEQLAHFAQLLPLRHQSIWLIDTLQPSWQDWNVLGWRTALLDFERTWLQPLLHAWRQQRISGLILTAPGHQATLQLELRRRDRLRFWCQARPLASLAIPTDADSTAQSSSS